MTGDEAGRRGLRAKVQDPAEPGMNQRQRAALVLKNTNHEDPVAPSDLFSLDEFGRGPVVPARGLERAELPARAATLCVARDWKGSAREIRSAKSEIRRKEGKGGRVSA